MQQLYDDKRINYWLCVTELQRNELQHHKKVISDEEFEDINLINVL